MSYADKGTDPKPMIPALGSVYERFAELYWPLIRVTAGVILFTHGWPKVVMGVQAFAAGSLAKRGIEPSLPLAYLVVFLETIGAILITHAALPRELSGSVTFILARSFAYHLTSIYALKMAGVFLLTASTIVLRTGITARWTAFVGYAAAALIILGSHFMDWTFLIFPIWVLVVSIDILIREYGSQAKAS